jgi:hypothetical protein
VSLSWQGCVAASTWLSGTSLQTSVWNLDQNLATIFDAVLNTV